MNNVLISFVTPVYKAEQFIRQCVDSMLAQTYTNTGNGYQDNLVIQVHIYNKDIKCLQYKTLAHKIGKECINNPSFETALEIPETEEYCRHNGIKALLIQYDYYDEVVVFDSSVIRKVG